MLLNEAGSPDSAGSIGSQNKANEKMLLNESVS